MLKEPATAHQNVWFKHEGQPVHFRLSYESISMLKCHIFLHAIPRWIGRGRPVTWLPCSSALNSFDFFFWGRLKSLVL
ncbi:hypothetical protein TNCV_342501 [Trichonephila clavipes]|nr:hypothetical protein TNCV_342501 [Trichonephila clavipes]